MKHRVAFALLAGLLLTMTWVFAVEDIEQDLSGGIVRLHILANSDSSCDQSLKLKVRDRLLSAAGQNPEHLSDNEILCICRDEIRKNGYDYSVSVERGTFFFPRKSYGNLTLPAGDYRALRICIGDGSGKNWWCVMYPPLCFTGEMATKQSKETLAALQNTVGREGYTMISETETVTIKPSFKLYELWQQVKSSFR
ncbi:MAG: stage II sporulation protein R [Clostridia bacterium]|nr:stage II sporulation protein R [Clostridia bacterium]